MIKSYKKCPECGELNLNAEYCKNCGALIDLRKRRKLERKRKESQEKLNIESPNKLTLFFENAKNHKNILVRIFARFFYSIWILVIGVAGIAAMIILCASA